MPKSPPNTYSRRVPAVDQATQVLFALARCQGARLPLTELCREVGIHKSKGYAILNTLQDAGLVIRDRVSKTYGLGAGLLVLSRALLDHSGLGELANPVLEALAEATGSTALLGQRQGDRVVIVARREVPGDLGVTIRVGHRYPVTWGAHGRAWTAALPEGRRAEVLSGEVWFDGRPVVPSVDERPALEAELAEAARLGYACDRGEVQRGVRAVAGAVGGGGPEPAGCVVAVGTFGPEDDAVVGEQVCTAARTLQERLGPILGRGFSPSEPSPNRRRP